MQHCKLGSKRKAMSTHGKRPPTAGQGLFARWRMISDETSSGPSEAHRACSTLAQWLVGTGILGAVAAAALPDSL